MSGTRVLQFPVRPASEPPECTAPELLGRGLYVARYGVSGCKVFHVLTSTGDRLAEVTLPQSCIDREGFVIVHLRGLLDAVDPVGPTLVR
jgi:hypothetical protein